MSDEKYVTLTEALEWEKRVRADELYEVLVEARKVVQNAEYREKTRKDAWALKTPEVSAETLRGSRALLEAARWFRDNEWHDDGCWEGKDECQLCSECGESKQDGHKDTCTVGRWRRAAERAGI